jgi:hypothetical protein
MLALVGRVKVNFFKKATVGDVFKSEQLYHAFIWVSLCETVGYFLLNGSTQINHGGDTGRRVRFLSHP